MSITGDFSEQCALLCKKGFPDDVYRRSHMCLADFCHAVLSGASAESPAIVRRYLGARRDAEAAALYLGTASAVCEIDDVHKDTSMHTGSAVISAALAASGMVSCSYGRLLAGIIMGYEAAIRLSIAAGERHYRYFHSTATCGTIAAATAASVILGSDPITMTNALGIAATMAAGLWEDINAHAPGVKHIHSGLAAERGIKAATLASAGLKGASLALEGPKGFFAAMARKDMHFPLEDPPSEKDLQKIMLDGLGRNWAIMRNIFKKYPFCLGCFEPLESLKTILLHEKRPVSEIASVHIGIYPPTHDLVKETSPNSIFQAKFSAVFALSLLLAGYDPSCVRLKEEWLSDPEVKAWEAKMACEAAPDLKSRQARVTVFWKDGMASTAQSPLHDLEHHEIMKRCSEACHKAGEDGNRLFERLTSINLAESADALLPLLKSAALLQQDIGYKASEAHQVQSTAKERRNGGAADWCS